MTWSLLLYLMKPSLLNLFIKTLTRGPAVPVISAKSSVQCLIDAVTGKVRPGTIRIHLPFRIALRLRKKGEGGGGFDPS